MDERTIIWYTEYGDIYGANTGLVAVSGVWYCSYDYHDNYIKKMGE
jgi:hypothetical protein